MSNILYIDGKEYHPATLAGKHFGYTKDYILLLIKKEKIDGKKIGNKWYVHIPSAEDYFSHAAKTREVQLQQISLERKAELRKYSAHISKKVAHQNTALIQTLVILILGLSIGATGYLGTTVTQQAAVHGGTNFFESLALAVYHFIVPEHTKHIALQQEEQTAISAHVGTTTYTSLVVAPDELLTTTTVDSIRDSFSDPVDVSVDLKHPDTGIIVPLFKNHNGEAYRFLMVPVTQTK